MALKRPPLFLFCAALVLLTSACCLTPVGCRGERCAAPPPPLSTEETKPAVMAGAKGLKTTPLLEEKAVVQPGAGSVMGVRIADHADKTRVVLDMTASPDASAKIESKGRKLAVHVPGMNWLGKKSWEADSAQLISGYRLEGDVLSVDLMYPSQVKAMETLPPQQGNKNHRLVIDLFSPEVHK